MDLSNNAIEALPSKGLENLNIVELNLSRNSIQVLPECLSGCKRFKVLRVEENSFELPGLPVTILSDSNVSLLCVDGNLFTKKDLEELPQYEQVFVHMYDSICKYVCTLKSLFYGSMYSVAWQPNPYLIVKVKEVIMG